MNIAPPRHLPRLAAAALALPLVLAGCGGPLSGRGTGEGIQVTASFYPLAYVAERIAGDHADVVNLTSPGVEPHDLELNVGQLADVADADLVVYERGLQPAVDEAVDQNGPDHLVDAAETVSLEQPDPADGPAAGPDPHFWLDPERVAEVAGSVEAQLSEVDPENAADYRANLDGLRQDLDELDHAYADGLAACETDTVVVSHDAFGYLEKYGLRFEPIAGLSPDSEPSAAHLNQVADLIREDGITTVFTETLASPALARTLAHDLGVETAVLDPIEGLGDATAHEDYLSLMRSNLEELKAANRCP